MKLLLALLHWPRAAYYRLALRSMHPLHDDYFQNSERLRASRARVEAFTKGIA